MHHSRLFTMPSSVSIVPVDSNESLYGNDPKFLNEVRDLCSTLLEEVFTRLKQLDRPEVLYFVS